MILFNVSIAASASYTTTQLTDNTHNNEKPQISNNGHVVWFGNYENSDNEIFSYNGLIILRLTNNDYEDLNPQINSNGHVVWRGFDGSDWEIFYAVPLNRAMPFIPLLLLND